MIKSKDKIKVEEEIADVAIYLLLLCNEMNVDLSKAILNKFKKNSKKYSVKKSKGNVKKYNKI
ncbi:MazG-like family protein [Tepidibacter thalassicus]|uniref:MazG nucleotide pyrophosphohydrolase domain-containing protein n=1 Tax=Tepidibacter thalassicus DSM 15285 TaxID=1123350 RepID=A0A1M5QL78_9FIRM|nr:MazG-like family protein [Tepidibacter thalassicus]SHH14551.1 MazG nucleotide pyrophosphohydrolase domain-containing protein [Tepidibacter thalassicus DSM 15285]